MTTLTPAPTPPSTSKSICARRGSQWLTPEGLEAHLAAVLRLENVGVLLGAGASKGPLGGRTMAEVWERFQLKCGPSADWLRDEGFVAGQAEVDVEKLIDDLEITRLEWERVKRPLKLRQLTRARADVLRTVVLASLLQPAWWKKPSMVDMSCDELTSHRQFLRKLTAARQPGQPGPWIFTTNYDVAVEWAAETIGLKVTNGFAGLHRRVFSPHNFDLGYRNVLARGEARFGTYNVYLAKLHGSLTWSTATDTTVQEFPTAHLWPGIRRFLSGEVNDLAGNLVYPSAAKYLQTVGFVFGELFRRFTEFLARPQSCLITSGYSFSDEHLNRILASALQNPTLQLVLYIPEVRRENDSLVLDDCNDWSKRVVGLELPQVTIVGDSDAYFGSLVNHLPDPVIYDEQTGRIHEMFKKNRDLFDSSTLDFGGIT